MQVCRILTKTPTRTTTQLAKNNREQNDEASDALAGAWVPDARLGGKKRGKAAKRKK